MRKSHTLCLTMITGKIAKKDLRSNSINLPTTYILPTARSNCETFCNLILFNYTEATQTEKTVSCVKSITLL